MQEFSGVVLQSDDAPVFEALYDGGKSAFIVKEDCQISAGDVIFGPLQSVGDQIIYNETRCIRLKVQIFLVRRHVGN